MFFIQKLLHYFFLRVEGISLKRWPGGRNWFYFILLSTVTILLETNCWWIEYIQENSVNSDRNTETELFQIGVKIRLFYSLVYVQLLKKIKELESGFLLPDLQSASFQVFPWIKSFQGHACKPMPLTCLPDHCNIKWVSNEKGGQNDQQCVCHIFRRNKRTSKLGFSLSKVIKL